MKETFLCFELGRATVIVAEDQLSLAIGKRGQNVRLAARLTGWDIDILTPAEYDKNIDDMEKILKQIDGVEDVLLDKLLAIGVVSLGDLPDVGTETLVTELGLTEELAAKIVEVATEAAPRLAAEADAAKAASKAAAAAEQAARIAAGGSDGPALTVDGQPVEMTEADRMKREAKMIAGLAAEWRAARKTEVTEQVESAQASLVEEPLP